MELIKGQAGSSNSLELRIKCGPLCTNDFFSTGHCSVINTSGDEWWMIYHAYKYGRIGSDPGRQVLIDKIKWSKDGWPFIGSASETPQIAPVIHSASHYTVRS